MLLGNRRTNRQEIDKGAFNLILDSRSETDIEDIIFTMKSLILAQDER